jgi:hypothetical protein
MEKLGPAAAAALQGQRPLVRLLQQAYSGELGAAIAYRGHAASVADPTERARIAAIRADELDHRARVGRMLAHLNAAPDPLLELRNRAVGAGIAAFCHVGGWFLPMYGAGWIERRNIAEYERAARLDAPRGAAGFAGDLLAMAEAEWDHERYFRLKAAAHWGARLLPVWAAPPPRACIRRDFARFMRDVRASAARPRPRLGPALLPGR